MFAYAKYIYGYPYSIRSYQQLFDKDASVHANRVIKCLKTGYRSTRKNEKEE